MGPRALDFVAEKAKRKPKLKMGDRVRDSITGFEGLLVSRTEWLYGCSRVGIEPTDLDKDGKPQDTQHFDEQRVERVKAQKPPVSRESRAKIGGPKDDNASRRADVKR